MSELLFKYYGVDWLAMILTIVSLVLLGRKKKEGFIFGILSNLSWLTFAALALSVANVLANFVFIGLNIKAYMNWRKIDNIQS